MEATTEKKRPPERDTRVDQFAISAFGDLGYKGRLPDVLVETYNNFQRSKGQLRQGRLSPEGFATVIALYEMNVSILKMFGE